MKKIVFAVLLATGLVFGGAAAVESCENEGCTILAWRQGDPEGELVPCEETCADACGGEEFVNQVTDLQTNCQCYCDEDGGQCVTK